MIDINGKYTNAKIMIDNVDENCIDQIFKMINHEAFENPVRIMPDVHYGKGSVIGFTMPIGNKLVPNVVGVDISCGMLSYNIGKVKINYNELDKKIKDKIPFGINIRKKPVINFERDIIDWKNLNWNYKYFIDLCKRVGIDQLYAQQSIGSVGSGNHFIEIGISEKTDDLWITVHSGSRNLGKKICEYWQDIASIHVNGLVDYNQGVEEIKKNYKKEDWSKEINKLKKLLSFRKKSDLDFIEEKNKDNYIEDMKFALWYSRMNRFYIISDIVKLITNSDLNLNNFIETIHNYIDFNDNIIRKGAIRSYIGEKMIIPFNMRDGILICEGKSNPDWNYSAPHGAGRVFSRSKARQELDLDLFKEEMKNIFSSTINKNTIDESPMAYKDSKIIEEAIYPTATIIDRIKPLFNMKDDSEDRPWKKDKNN